MNNIEKESTDNLGSVKKIEVVKAADITAFPAAGETEATAAQITLKSGVTWTDIYFTPESAEIKEEGQEDDGGSTDKVSVTARVPYINNVVDPQLKEMSKYPLVLRITDANNTLRIFGRQLNPLRLSYSRSIPNQPAGYNGYSISINGTLRSAPLFIVAEEVGS
jgi:hypothetical protein